MIVIQKIFRYVVYNIDFTIALYVKEYDVGYLFCWLSSSLDTSNNSWMNEFITFSVETIKNQHMGLSEIVLRHKFSFAHSIYIMTH